MDLRSIASAIEDVVLGLMKGAAVRSGRRLDEIERKKGDTLTEKERARLEKMKTDARNAASAAESRIRQKQEEKRGRQ